MSRSAKSNAVLNRSAAPIQITAEQIILEARDRSNAARPPPPKEHITDPAELASHKLRRRKEFEDALKHNRNAVGVWLRYAKWEESHHEIERARSIYERAIGIDFRNPALWVRYAELEMRNSFINRARNVWDRAVSLLPRIDALWFKYTYMEEALRNIPGARTLFERWMRWEPGEHAWLAFIIFEERSGDISRTRGVYERYIASLPGRVSYIRYAKWEERHGQAALARRIFERALDELLRDERDAAFFSAFARFEERCREFARAEAIYKHALSVLPANTPATEALRSEYVALQKQHGDKQVAEDLIIAKRRSQYESLVAANPHNYDAWFDLTRLEESEAAAAMGVTSPDQSQAFPSAALAAIERTREAYERAVANIPPLQEKRFWRRYMYLWINYAIFEECIANDRNRARAVYRAALGVVPHRIFTFAKLWLLAAKLEVRAKDLPAARKLLGAAIGLSPKPRIFRGYIDLEHSLGEIDRCRKLYERYLQIWPHSVGTWTRYAELEKSVGEDERALALLDLAVSQPTLDLPEVAWKAYIDFEIERGNLDAARALYGRLLSRTQHVKVWLSLATFEANVAADAARARDVYERAYIHFKTEGGPQSGDARALLLDTWIAFESALADAAAAGGDTVTASTSTRRLADLRAKLPRKVVRRRELHAGNDPAAPVVGWEEYFDYIFPDDETKPASLKLLELAQKWKARGGAASSAASQIASSVEAQASENAEDHSTNDANGSLHHTAVFDETNTNSFAQFQSTNFAASAEGEGTDVTDGYDPNAVNLDDDDGDEAEDSSRQIEGPPMKRFRESQPMGEMQSATEERGEGDDPVYAKEVERELEDAVRASTPPPPQEQSQLSSNPDSSAQKHVTRSIIPRDLYSEEDAGDTADRDI